MWSETDARYFISVVDKAGAYSWLAIKSQAMYERRLFWMQLVGILIVVAAGLWSVVVGVIGGGAKLQEITLIIGGIAGEIGIGLKCLDKLLGYVDEIKQYSLLYESYQLLYWTVVPALQSIGQPDEVDVKILREIVNTKQKEIIKKTKEFPKSIIEDYYAAFKDDAIDYNVLFNDKIDAKMLMQKLSMANVEGVVVNMDDTKETELSPEIVRLDGTDNIDEESTTTTTNNFLHAPRFRHMATIKPMSEDMKNKRQKLTKMQKYELDKYTLQFEHV